MTGFNQGRGAEVRRKRRTRRRKRRGRGRKRGSVEREELGKEPAMD